VKEDFARDDERIRKNKTKQKGKSNFFFRLFKFEQEKALCERGKIK
jgi:hypothetical protein